MAEREQMMAVDKRPAAPPVVRQELFGRIIHLHFVVKREKKKC